jgi:hypothetical protein
VLVDVVPKVIKALAEDPKLLISLLLDIEKV